LGKQIVTASYWLGIVSSLVALGLRSINILGMQIPTLIKRGQALSYMSFYRGALLFFLIAIATASYAWVREGKT
jgi:hypothetical protein